MELKCRCHQQQHDNDLNPDDFNMRTLVPRGIKAAASVHYRSDPSLCSYKARSVARPSLLYVQHEKSCCTSQSLNEDTHSRKEIHKEIHKKEEVLRTEISVLEFWLL